MERLVQLEKKLEPKSLLERVSYFLSLESHQIDELEYDTDFAEDSKEYWEKKHRKIRNIWYRVGK